LISDKSIGVYKDVLCEEEIAYIETVCRLEMQWLDYTISDDRDHEMVIKTYSDKDVTGAAHLSADYSELPENIAIELERLKRLKHFYEI
jgi:hypothetical protein